MLYFSDPIAFDEDVPFLFGIGSYVVASALPLLGVGQLQEAA